MKTSRHCTIQLLSGRSTLWRITALSIALWTVSFVGACGEPRPDSYDLQVIYGEDDRLDIMHVSDPRVRRLAASTVALVRAGSMVELGEGSGFVLPARRLNEQMNLCPSEPFGNQPSPAFCSGFLVGEDLVATAGHCIRSQFSCDSTAFVFDFAYRHEGEEPIRRTGDDVYRCAELIHSEDQPYGADFAVIRLDRAVVGREPLEMNRHQAAVVGAELTVIGHPSGLPTKVAEGGIVRRVNEEGQYLVASVDAFGGNSGSAVVNSRSGLVEGILVRGERDFESRGGCLASVRCPKDGCRGEDVTLARVLAPFVPEREIIEPEPERQTTVTRVFSGKGLGVVIPDNDRRGVHVRATATQGGIVTGVAVSLTITHSYIGDLSIKAIHPDGTEILLRHRQGGHRSNLDEQWNSESSDLAQLVGKPADGRWIIQIADTLPWYVGKLEGVKLTITSLVSGQ